MDINSAKMIIKAATMADDAVLLEGVHGIGKSDIVKQFAKENDYHCEVLFLSHQEVADIIGIPHMIERDGISVTTWSVPIWLQRMYKASSEGKKCILFLDELNRAPLDVRQSALQLVLERQIHEHKLPTTDDSRTMIVAAINPADEYQVDELDPALLDRFLLAKVDVDVKSWLNWSRENNINRIVRDFITEFPNRLHFTPIDGGTGSSPRSWSKLSNYIDNIKEIPNEIIFQIIKGKVGTEIGSQFYMFLQNFNDIIKLEDIENLVKEESKNTSNIEDISEKVEELISSMEAIQKTEIAEQLMKKYMTDDTTDILPFLTYLYALPSEICQSFLKKMKSSSIDQYKKLVEVDDELNGKELFLRLVRKIQ